MASMQKSQHLPSATQGAEEPGPRWQQEAAARSTSAAVTSGSDPAAPEPGTVREADLRGAPERAHGPDQPQCHRQAT